MSGKQATKRDANHKGSPARTCEARRVRRRSRSAPAGATIGASKQSGRAARERSRPDTGGYNSHVVSAYCGLNLAGSPIRASR
jgi:hypothetical protein